MKSFNLKSLWTKLKTLAPRKVILYSLILVLLVASFFVFKNNIFKADVSGAPVMTASSFYTWPTDSSFTTFAVLDGAQTDGKTISLAQDNTAGVSVSAKSVILRPTSDAFNPDGNAVPSQGTDLFSMVKEVTPDDSATYISPSGTFANVMFGHGAHGIPAGMTVTGVKVYAKVSGISTIPSTNLLGIYNNNQAYFGEVGESDQSVSGDWKTLSQNFPVCPFKVNKPWTFADLDAMAFGGVFGNTVKGAKMTQIYTEVSYDLVRYKMTGTATLENFTFKEGRVHIKNAVVDKTENGGTVKIEYSSDNFAWQEDPKDLRSVAQLFIRVTLTTPINTKTPILNKISLEYVSVSAPTKPIPESPASGASVSNSKPELKASAFTQPDGAIFTSSEWEISTSPTLTSTGKFKSPVPGIASTRDASISYTPNMSLTPDKKYFWHVRYKDSYGFSSDWSDAVFFTVKALEKPVNISPAPDYVGSTMDGIPQEPTLRADFKGNAATGTNWAILSNDTSGNLAEFAGAGTYTGTSVDSFRVTKPLERGKPYIWKVQYWVGTPSNVSPWSDPTFFTVTNNSLIAPEIVSPVYGANLVVSVDLELKADFKGVTPDRVNWKITHYEGGLTYIDLLDMSDSSSDTHFLLNASRRLEKGKVYNVKVSYQKDGNTSDWSVPTRFTVREAVPVVQTSSRTDVTIVSAVFNGNIVSTDGAVLTTKGFVYGLSPDESVCERVYTNTNLEVGPFSIKSGYLEPGKTYYFRAFTGNTDVAANGDWFSFPVPAYKVTTLPVVTTSAPASITANSAVVSGNITAVGATQVIKRGFEVTKIKDTAQANYSTTGSFEVGEFKANINLAVPNSTYYVRAYATNSTGTGYGDWAEFKSLSNISTPQVATLPVTSIGTNLASFRGNTTSIGGAPVTKRGFQVTRDKTKVQADYPEIGSFGTGEFTKTNVSLYFSNSTYYVRAYATNSVGTAYGDWVEFKTLAK